MINPINSKVRGILYVISVVIGGLLVVIAPLLELLQATALQPVLTAVAGAVLGIIGTLARSNLTLSDGGEHGEAQAWPQRADAQSGSKEEEAPENAAEDSDVSGLVDTEPAVDYSTQPAEGTEGWDV